MFNQFFLGISLFFAFAFCLADAQTSTVYVDFGISSLTTSSPDANGRYWNNATEATTSGISNLINDKGKLTGIAMSFSGVVAANPFGTTIPDAETLNGLAIPNATRDWYFITPPNTLTVTISNLSPEGIYRLSLFGSRDISETRVTRYRVVGDVSHTQDLTTSGTGIGISPQPNANRSGLSIFDALVPASDGTLIITISCQAGAFAYLGAMRLETMNSVNSPPAATGLQVAGSARAGSLLRGRYNYYDFENDAESDTSFFWETTAAPGLPVSQATASSALSLEYIPTAADVGKYLRFCAAPRAATGRQSGLVARSGWVGPVVSSDTLTTFHIGSSYTLWVNIPYQLADFSNTSGKKLKSSGQLTAGRDSLYHWNAGFGGAEFFYNFGSPSRFEIPTRSWDTVVLQPYNTEWEPWTRAQMAEYAGRFYRLADANGSQFYLYSAWPKRADDVSVQDQINLTFEQVRASISVGGGKPALVIPAGQALRAVAAHMGSGDLVGYKRDSLYLAGDDRHVSHLGGYISALTHYATIHKTSPFGLPARTVDADFANDNLVTLPTAVAKRIQQIVWEVVQTYPYSGLGSTSFSNMPILPAVTTTPVIPSPIVEPDPPFVTESTTPSNPSLLTHAFGATQHGSVAPVLKLPKPVVAETAGLFAAEYTLNPVAEGEGVIYTPHWSYDLKNWTVTQPANTVITRTENTVRISWPNSSRWRFLRIHVSQPAQ
jgi:hypothetical protein